MHRTTAFCLSFCFLFSASVLAQDLETALSRYMSSNGKMYLQPMGDAFGANLNSGIYHSAHIPRIGLRIRIGIETMFTTVTDDMREFTATTEGYFEPQQSVKTATVFGKSGARVDGTAGIVYAFPDGFNVSAFPMAVPQITVGAFMGTEVSVRWFKADLGDNYGELSLNGFGIRHSISQYLPLFPVHIAAHVNRQGFKLGDIIDASALSFGVEASKSFGLLELYGGLAFESANLDINYTYEDDTENVDIAFKFDAANSARLTTGLSFNLPFVNIHTDYNFGATKVFNVGLEVGK